MKEEYWFPNTLQLPCAGIPTFDTNFHQDNDETAPQPHHKTRGRTTSRGKLLSPSHTATRNGGPTFTSVARSP